MDKVLQEHNLPERVAKFMPEDRTSEIADTMEELFGLHPPSWLLVRKVTETILHLAELGNVILIGRGAAVVTAKSRRTSFTCGWSAPWRSASSASRSWII